ncbi:hypothetical protein A4X13_0g7569 [Tilletia indica]|uniref:Uncharacterized protein n=1 Tax=Tilletia indica TaxID=43049 RepID=A0A177TUW5_9BASI|nr:hypothetical protein A4X13_0g7569 [Tilletia indica]
MASSQMDIDGGEMEPVCQLSRLPSELVIYILKKLSPRDVLHFGLTCGAFWQIATDPQLWRHLHNQAADPLRLHLAPNLHETLSRTSVKTVDVKRTRAVSRKGKERMTSEEPRTSPVDEWKSWASLTLVRDNAARQLAFYSIGDQSRILLGKYGETVASLVGMLESRDGSVSPSTTVNTLKSLLFPASTLGRHRFRHWIFPRQLSKQSLFKELEQEEFEAKSRKRRRIASEPPLKKSEDLDADAERDRSDLDLKHFARRIEAKINAFSTQQFAAELHCLHGPLYSNQRDIMEAGFWQELCDPRDPLAPSLKPKSKLLHLLSKQRRGSARPCSAAERMAAQLRIYDSGNFGHANQWGPLRPWIATRSAIDPSSAEPAPTISVPGINADPEFAIVELNTLQGAAIAASVLDQLEENGAASHNPPQSSSPVAEAEFGSAAVTIQTLEANNQEEDDEAEEEDPDFVPGADWDAETDEADPGSEEEFGAQLELAMSEASSRRSVAVNQRVRERRQAGQLFKAIDWELVEAIMLCMHSNIEDAKQMRGWGLHLPTALYEMPNNALPNAASGSANRIITIEEQRRQEAEGGLEGNMDVDGPLTRRRRRSLMEATTDTWFDPLRVPTGWDKSHGPDPRREPGANPRDWAGVEGVWIGTYVFCAYQTALARGIDFDHLEADVVGDCLQLCLRVLPEGELLPPADEELCAQPPVGNTEGYELLPESGDQGAGDAEILPPLRVQGHAVQYTHSGQSVRRSTIYGMVRPIYGYVSSTQDAGRSPLHEDVLGEASGEGSKRSRVDDEHDRATSSKPDSSRSRRLVIKGYHWNLCHRYLNSNSWSLSGIQPGGLGSRLPILGIWTDADRGAAQPSPCGPWLYYRVGNRYWEDVESELESIGS